jgi:hypothetical protein
MQFRVTGWLLLQFCLPGPKHFARPRIWARRNQGVELDWGCRRGDLPWWLVNDSFGGAGSVQKVQIWRSRAEERGDWVRLQQAVTHVRGGRRKGRNGICRTCHAPILRQRPPCARASLRKVKHLSTESSQKSSPSLHRHQLAVPRPSKRRHGGRHARSHARAHRTRTGVRAGRRRGGRQG